VARAHQACHAHGNRSGEREHCQGAARRWPRVRARACVFVCVRVSCVRLAPHRPASPAPRPPPSPLPPPSVRPWSGRAPQSTWTRPGMRWWPGRPGRCGTSTSCAAQSAVGNLAPSPPCAPGGRCFCRRGRLGRGPGGVAARAGAVCDPAVGRLRCPPCRPPTPGPSTPRPRACAAPTGPQPWWAGEDAAATLLRMWVEVDRVTGAWWALKALPEDMTAHDTLVFARFGYLYLCGLLPPGQRCTAPSGGDGGGGDPPGRWVPPGWEGTRRSPWACLLFMCTLAQLLHRRRARLDRAALAQLEQLGRATLVRPGLGAGLPSPVRWGRARARLTQCGRVLWLPDARARAGQQAARLWARGGRVAARGRGARSPVRRPPRLTAGGQLLGAGAADAGGQAHGGAGQPPGRDAAAGARPRGHAVPGLCPPPGPAGQGPTCRARPRAPAAPPPLHPTLSSPPGPAGCSGARL
jgi:hypothetical protein